MKTIHISDNLQNASQIALGCMRMNSVPMAQLETLIETALECGINYFDHADIYGGGDCEALFSQAAHLTDDKREKMVIQSKCGICNGYFDFSKEHIINAVDGILKRLNTDYLDVLLLHRPDTLMEPEEVAEAFSLLSESGKVLNFGVSNQNPTQIALLQKFVKQKLVINQLQLSITNTPMIDSGFHVNMQDEASIDHDGGILDYCRLNDLTIQPWSPFQFGFFEGAFLGNEKFPELNAKIHEIAEVKGVTDTAIAIAWILRHPANMQPIVGTMNPKRLRDISSAADVKMSRPEWYEIYRAAGNRLP